MEQALVLFSTFSESLTKESVMNLDGQLVPLVLDGLTMGMTKVKILDDGIYGEISSLNADADYNNLLFVSAEPIKYSIATIARVEEVMKERACPPIDDIITIDYDPKAADNGYALRKFHYPSRALTHD